MEEKPDRLHTFSREVLEQRYRSALETITEQKETLVCVADDLAAARTQLRDIVAGSDPTQPAEGTTLTAGQLWHRLLNMPVEERLLQLRRALEADDQARSCFVADHAGRMQYAETELEARREQLSHAVFSEVTLDGHSELLTAVRALRSVMVDGIAKRPAGQLTVMSVHEHDEGERPDFPVEKGVQERVGEQLKSAGIDLQAVCDYLWDNTDEHGDHDHQCGLTNPLHAGPHACASCATTLTHEDAERLVNG